MTVNDLIKKLSELPHDAMVVVRGYEDGVNEVNSIVECNVKPFSQGNDWFYGSLEISKNDGERAVFINSTRDSEKTTLERT